jgi:hypothetical protein
MKKYSSIFIALGLLGVLLVNAQPSAAFDPWKGPYLVIANDDHYKWSPAVAYNSLHDEYLVVWETWAAYHEIHGRRISSDGTLLASFLISNATYPSGTFNRNNPAVAYDSIHDRYLVVWAYDYYGDGSDWDVYGRYLSWDGPDPSLPEFSIASDRINEYKPKVAFNFINGDYLVVWLTDGTPDLPVAGILIHSNGTYTFLNVSSGGTAVRDFPTVTFNSGLNQYLVAWDVDNSSTKLDVYAVRIDSLGAIVPPGEIVIANSTKYEQRPALAACAQANQFLLTYQQTRNGATDDDIFGSFLNGTGTLTGPFFVAGTTAPQGFPAASCNFAGSEYFVAWHDMYAQPQYRYGIWGKWLQPDNSSQGDFEIVSPSDLSDRLYPAVASGKTNTLVVWQHDRDNPPFKDIWGVFLALKPPDAFNKTGPANGATNQSTAPTLTWDPSSGTTSYEYCYDTTNNNACDGSWTSVDRNTTAAALSGLIPGTTYYWQVRANNSIGTTYAQGSPTAYWAFSTASNPPAAFNKTSPVNGATNQSTAPTLTWGASSGATSYEYCYDTTNNNACDGSWTSTGTGTSASLSGLAPGATYYWQVRGRNAVGTTEASGGWWSFTVAVSPPSNNFTIYLPLIKRN